MKFIWVFNGAKLKQYFVILMAAIFAIGIAYAEQQNIAVFTQTSKAPAAIYKVETDQKKLALTFDISWGEHRAAPILDILEQKGVKKATFFLSAEWSKEHPDIVKRILKQGYEIGSHGYKHINYSRLTDDEIRQQIRKADTVLQEVTGKKPNLIRTPNGDIDKRVLQIADELNYTVIQWDTDSKDWLNPGVEQIVHNVVSHAHPGDIILLHASDSSKQTHLALPTIIDQLKGKGYEFTSVSELIADAKVKAKEID
ncbi:polysaccharide deacetylase family sporulation protein PdaB [Ammoniphilus sp. CFH 90114]|uniref:polysaccharide deacetylase family sporulation protein PdaB n=1 Tax=Ammoniphilus sp. CFH 90114 TaxID=2493665 RepID=UPI00100E314E|nr:polysaccharide deacetylase family sporulation protein PdaB [Ammoniphilus sp. CFH 90114]RXT05327.1 polysaccharide deacetylase family sporulation protein PdaB [Ammoniphilus sp. CFH 90114]